MVKAALLIGVSEYEAGLTPRPCAVRDVEALRQVLIHPDMGGFAEADVTTLQNPDRQMMETAIYHLFANRQKDDLVLLYFSGHGVFDEGGEFYFATRQTQKEQGRLMPTTAVAARSVQGWMEHSRSQRQVVMLDSCFSGAFARGVKAKDSGSVNVEQYLGGRGRAILTASTSTQYALTQDGLDLSVYTHYLVEGIRTGGADLDDDGFIAVEELHTYASAKVREAAPAMTPEFYPVKEGYKILLARSPQDDPKLKYRKAVEQRVYQGRLSIPARRLLDSLKLQLMLASNVAEEIEAEILKPYREYQRKLQEYEQTLVEALQAENPLSQRTLNDLKDYQQHLALLDEDVAQIEMRLIGGQSQGLIVFYTQALRKIDPQESPSKWAEAQCNLASAYFNQTGGDRAENIERAIASFESALQVYTPKTFPENWAKAQATLATAYSERIQGDRADNIERAIATCQSALQVYTRDDFPEDWARTQSILAQAYSERIQGDRAENIERAIAACESALQGYTREDFPEQWANAQSFLAQAYSNRIRGDRSENLERAIASCESALQVYTRETFPEEWANTQIILASAYLGRIRGDHAENLEAAITAYQQSLQVMTREAMPVEWARLMMNLANAYSNRIRGNRAQNIEQAITAYQQALTLATPTVMPVEWANVMMNLATAYASRVQGDRAENLEQAIKAYQQALMVVTQTAMPLQWATIMNDLAKVYFERIEGNRAENLEEAINYFEQALTVRTRRTMPIDWAQSRKDLAFAYMSRIRGDRTNNLEEAISSYQKALEVYTPRDFPERWVQIQNEIGKVFEEQQRYDEAIARYDQVIAMQPNFAEAWTNRGNVLAALRRYEEAIASYDQALAVQPDTSNAWNSRGVVLAELEQYEEAIASYDRAIALQPDLSRAWDNRGEALEELGRHEEAIASYDQALQLQPDVAEVWNHRGRSLRSLHQLNEAIASFNRAIELKPHFCWAIANRGRVYQLLERYEEALQDFNRAIEIDPDYVGAIAQRGETYRLMLRYEDALQDFNHAIELEPNNIWAIAQRGQTLAEMNRYEEARQDYECALAIGRERGDRRNEAICLRNLGNTYQEPTESQQAIECFQRSLEISQEIGDVQNQATALSSLGNVHASVEQHLLAIEYCQQALSLYRQIGDRHNESLVLVDLADVYQALSNYQQSIDLYEQVLAIVQEAGYEKLEALTQSKLVQVLLKSKNFERAIAVAQSIPDQEKRFEALTTVIEEVRRIGGDRTEELLASIDRSPRSTENLQASIVRIYAENGAAVGSGFLITSNYLVTCAHVITQALGLPVDTRDAPSHPITLDFPFDSLKQRMSAQVDFWSPVEDIAGLKLENTFPENIQPIQLSLTSKEDLSRHPFKSFGFPRGHQNGVWVSGSLVGKTAQGWLQLETNDFGYSFEPGFSGAPILDEVLGGVVGMLVAVERRREAVKAAFAIPSSLLSRVLNHLRTSSINAVVISPDNQFILTGNSDGTVRLQNFRGISIGFPFQGHQRAIWSVAVSPDGQLIASGSEDGTIRLWNLQGQFLEQPFRGHEGAVYSVAFSPDGQLLVSGSADATLRLWDLRSNLNIQTFQGHTGIISSVAFSPDGQVIASASDDKTIRLWDLQGRLTSVIQGHTSWVNSVTFSPDGQLVASGSDDRTVRLWDLYGNPVGHPLEGHTGSVSSVVFSPDAARIVSGSVDQTIRVWDRHGHPVTQPLTGHTDAVKAVAFSPDGETIVSGGRDQSIRLWHLPSLLEQQVLEPISEQLFVVYELLMSVSTDTISVGAELEVTINLNSLDSFNNDSAYLFEIPRNKALGSELNILLNASGLRLESDNTASLPLDTDEIQFSSLPQTQTAYFCLTALRPGVTTITAEIYRGDTFETTLETTIQVIGLEEAPFLDTNIKTEPRPVSQPDLVLQVQTLWNETASACTFRYHLKSFRAASFLRSGISYQSQQLSRSLLEQVHNLLQTELETLSDALPTDGRSHLISLGHYLFQHLFPAELQADLCNLNRYQSHTLLILADQDAQFPWTLLHNGQEFLGERFIIGHWLWDLNNTQPYEFPVGSINIAHYANVEQPEVWATLLEPPGAPPPLTLTGGVLDDLAATEAMRGLHLIRMGQSTADGDRQDAPVPLETATDQDMNQKIRPIKLNLRRNRPLVTLGYLRQDQPELTHLQQTWAATFLRAGCSAFVGTLWAVNPSVEAAFMSSFYHALWTGDSLGGAFHTARRLARATVPDSLDWLAYLLFGDPMARPYRPVQGQGYAVVEPIGQDIDDPVPLGTTIRFRVSLRRTPPIWHEERVIEVAETLNFTDLQAHIVTFGLQVTPSTSIPLHSTPTGNYLGWFNIAIPPDITGDSALVQVYFADGMQTIHTLTFPLKFQQEGNG